MDPHIFGRGTWILLFTFLYLFGDDILFIKKAINDELITIDEIKKKIQTITLIKDKLEHNERLTYLNDLKYTLMEIFMRYLNILLKALPCNHCVKHTLEGLKNNKILDTPSFFIIFHFFIELRNSFYINKIDRRLFNTIDNINKNKPIIFNILLKD